MSDNGKFYWLKLKRDFFKRHDIRIIEAMPNGKDYILFYLKLLCESVDHNGNLRFSDQIPYSEQMLSTITDTNIDIVRSAIEVFTKLGMMDILDDGTIFMNEVQNMIGSAVNNDNANRQRRFRERKKAEQLQDCYDSVTKNNESKSIEKELEKDNSNMCDSLPYEKEFESLWKTYPNKKGRKNALRHYTAARKNGISFDVIKEGLEKYIRHIDQNNTKIEYVKNGSTWFCQECWNDEYKTDEEIEEERHQRIIDELMRGD